MTRNAFFAALAGPSSRNQKPMSSHEQSPTSSKNANAISRFDAIVNASIENANSERPA